MSSEVKIIIADDHPLFREGVRAMIKTEKSFTIIGEADNGRTALKLIEKHQPHIAILDIAMPEMNGFDVVRAIRKKNLPVEIIILTMYREENLFKAAVGLGIKGYILKDCARTDIVRAIKSVSQGEAFLSSELSSIVMNQLLQSNRLDEKKAGLESLSPTQLRVLKLISEDKTSKEIAAILCISQRTVETHRSKINLKLDLHGSLALVKYAILHKSELSDKF